MTAICFMKKYLNFILVFGFVLAICIFVQSGGNLPDPDSFYHAAMSEVIAEHGAVKTFPWLQFTHLRERFVDHHFLYHQLLAPFLKYADALTVTRVASAVFAILAVGAFYFIQKKKQIKPAEVSTVLLLLTSTFLLRINLAKGVAPAIFLLLFFIWALFERKKILLFILSAIYPWLYAGWPMALLVLLVNILAIGLLAWNGATANRFKQAFAAIFTRANVLNTVVVISGLAAGIISSPYFPNNLWLTWVQAIKIGVVNYQNKIPVGLEWYPYSYGEMISIFVLAWLFAACALLALVFSAYKNKGQSLDPLIKSRMGEAMTVAMLAGIFFVLTIKSKRSAEYFVPLLLLAASWCLDIALRVRPGVLKELLSFIQLKKLRLAFLIYLFLAAVWIAGRDTVLVRSYFKNGFSPIAYKGVAEAIKKASEPGDIVFHADWDDFPLLFYWNREQYYIAGLDPTFFYEYDQGRYMAWRQAVTGFYDKDIYFLIKNDFGAKAVFTDHNHKKFKNMVSSDNRFVLIYEDKDGSVYKVK